MLWISLIFITVSSFASQDLQVDIAKATKMLSFAKQSLIESTAQAKNEFGMNNEEKKNESATVVEGKYSSAEFRDIFFPVQTSSLITQAYDYFKEGKKLYVKSQDITSEQLEKVIKPILRLSSLIYESPQQWVVFTNIGKFTYRKPFVGDIKIVGISSSEVEFTMPINTNLSNVDTKNEIEHRDRVFIDGKNLISQMRTGECIFEKDLKITTKCNPIIEKLTVKTVNNIEKPIEI